MLVNGWAAAASEATRLVRSGEASALSLDVFDTLLMRRTHPETALDAVCAEAGAAFGATRAEARRARSAAWSTLVARSLERGSDPDVHSDDLWAEWARLLGAGDDPGAALVLRGIETRVETAAVAPNAAMLALLAALPPGLPVIAVSDMYLGSGVLREMLDAHGFSRVGDVVSSGETGFQKRTGRLFPRVAARLGLAPASILHVGDDLLADGEMAEAGGFRSMVVDDPATAARRAASLTARRAARLGEPLAAALEAEASALLMSGSPPGARGVGRTAFGPVYAPFVNRLAAAAVEGGLDQVWFFAREGVLLRELYEARRSVGDPLALAMPPSGYMPVSRLATLRATMAGLGEREFRAVASNAPAVTAARLLSLAGMSAADARGAAVRCGLADENSPIVARSTAFWELARDPAVDAVFRSTGRSNAEGFRAWLDASGFLDAGRVGVVDVGWGAQIQEYLAAFLAGIDGAPSVTGLYLGTDAKAEARRGAGMSIEALVVDGEAPSRAGRGIFEFLIGFEMVTRAAHATVVGFSADGCPVLGSDAPGRAVESRDDPLIAALQQGVVDYARAWFPAAVAAGVDPRDAARLAAVRAERLAVLPPRDAAACLLGLTNVANLGSDEEWSAGGALSLLAPRRSLRLLRSTFWQEGTAAASFGLPGAAGMLALKRLRSLRSPRLPTTARPAAPPFHARASRPAPVRADEALYAGALAARATLALSGGDTVPHAGGGALADVVLNAFLLRRPAVSWWRVAAAAAVERGFLPPARRAKRALLEFRKALP